MKIRFLVLALILAFMPVVSFATNDNLYNSTESIAKSVVQALSWFGYIMAFALLIIIGIKYVTSPAKEKANLKGKIPMYLFGVLLIVCASMIARAVANIAGNEGAEPVINKGIELAGLEIGEPQLDRQDNYYYETQVGDLTVYSKNDIRIEDKDEDTADSWTNIQAPMYDGDNRLLYWKVVTKDGSVDMEPANNGVLECNKYVVKEVYPVYSNDTVTVSLNDIEKIDKIQQKASYVVPERVNANTEYHNKLIADPWLKVPETSANGKRFKYWIVEEYDANSGTYSSSKKNVAKITMPELEDKKCEGKQYTYIAVYD